MIAEGFVVAYLAVGLSLAIFASRMDKSSGSPPEIQGFMVITLMWPAPLLMAGYMAIDQKL